MKKVMIVLMVCGLVISSYAATAGFGNAIPSVCKGVQNLNFSTDDATNTAVQYVDSDYLADDNSAALGQTFTTGSDADGYVLTAISVRQVSWGTTWWDYTGGTVTLQIFQIENQQGNGVSDITELALETASIGGEDDGIGLSSGTPGIDAQWLTVTLDTPVNLAPDTMYGFQIISDGLGSNDQFFMQIDGTSSDSYAGGFAIGTSKVDGQPDTASVWDGGNGQPSDRAFVATMSPPLIYASPANGYDLVPIERVASENDLVFAVYDPNITKFDVYFGTKNDPNLALPANKIVEDEEGFTLEVPFTVDLEDELTTDLQYETTYYWQVVGYEPNEVGFYTVAGPVWSFKTVPEDPQVIVDVDKYIAVDAGEPSIVLTVTTINGDSQWYKDGSPISDTTGVYSGTTTDQLTIHNVQLADEGYYYCTVSSLIGEASSSSCHVMTHRQTSYYDFDTIIDDVNDYFIDSIDGYNAYLMQESASAGWPTVSDANQTDLQVSFPGTNVYGLWLDNGDDDPNGQYLDIEDGVVDYEDITLMAWVFPKSVAVYARVFDFGSGETANMWLTPDTGNGYDPSFAITTGGSNDEQRITPDLDESNWIAPGAWHHVAVTISDNTGRIYVDGVLRATNTDMTITPIDIAATLNFIGKSQYSYDAEFDGLIDELKIYNYALNAVDIGKEYLTYADPDGHVCNLEGATLLYDYDGSCRIDLPDFAMFAGAWLNENWITLP